MNKDIYTKAMDHLKVSDDFVEKTMERIKLNNKNLTSIENPSIMPRRFFAIDKRYIYISICLLIIILGTTMVFPRKHYIKLEHSSKNVSVQYINKTPNISISNDLVPLTEDEILGLSKSSRLDFLKQNAIFKGTILKIKNIKISFGKNIEYRAIMSVKIQEVLKGDILNNDTIEILLPCPIAINGYWQEDTDVISQVRQGMDGIFIANKYDEDSYWQQDDETLYLKDICDYGFPDGVRFAFLDAYGKIIYDEYSFASLHKPTTLLDVKKYILEMINKK